MFSVKVGENMKASSFKEDTKLYIDPGQVLPMSRFLPRPPIQKGAKTSASGTGGRGGRGGRGGGFSRGGRGGFRGGRGGRGGY